jgi:hypothetical protein
VAAATIAGFSGFAKIGTAEHVPDHMFVSAMVAHPALCAERGLRWIGRPRASHIERRPAGQNSEIYVDLDTSKLKISVSVSVAGREGEVRFFGDIDSTPEAVERLVTKLSKRHSRICFCYEAGPIGYGLYRQIAGPGHQYIVVAPRSVRGAG